VQLLHIRKALRGRLELVILAVNRFAQQLFGADLDWRGRLVLDAWWSKLREN
jgi:hypothetical protein